jgi:hypothetical protein
MRFASRALAGMSAFLVGLGACSDDGTGPDDEVTAPTGVTATQVSFSSARVTWNAVSGATGYVVERAEGSGTFAEVGTLASTTFDDVGLSPSTTYRYRVKTVSGSQSSPFSAEVSVNILPQQVVTVTQDITTNTTWTAANKYRLSGFIHVQNGATLTIEPGTVIEGDFDVLGSSLFILRGARIVANGTAAQPIVFTSSRPVGQRLAGDWGGLILVGNGAINRAAPVILEGTGVGPGNPQVDYAGGSNNADNSGSLRYVRVEFAGYATAQDQELNSFTFAAVGSGTQLENLQSLNGLDDAFEWFGGAVDGKYLVSYNSGDDHFDMSEGYVGRLQYLIGYQQVRVTPRPPGNFSSDPQGIENDGCNGTGCAGGQNSTPLTIPLVANFTLVGPPAGVNDQGSGLVGMMLRRGTGGYYVNGVVARWGRAAISIRDQTTVDRATAGTDFFLRNIYLVETGATFQAASGTTVQGTVDVTANAIEVAASGTGSALFTTFPATPANGATFDWTPAAGTAIRTGGLTTFPAAIATKAGTFVTGTVYRGAADPAATTKWWEGWTNYAVN